MDTALDISFCADDMPRNGFQTMDRIRDDLDQIHAMIDEAEDMVGDDQRQALDAIRQELLDFSPKVTFVGQVKAGKTALVNSLCGQSGLLPSDVNPWTSVVTSVHVNGRPPKNVRAEFRFFDRGEWDRLVQHGGRLGEMAQRANAAVELAEIRRQVEVMCAKSRQRLGRNFELLLGQRHKYDSFDSALIERYVCLGDPDEPESSKQGRFADITSSATLYVSEPSYPIALTFQDTPGVNDPFLMREQITLHTVRNASLCVVVLSATQALNTVDLALVQLLSSMEDRQVIVFVNRIDELERPEVQIEEIRASLRATFSRHSLQGIDHIIFGCARWADAAQNGQLDRLKAESSESLGRMIQAVEAARGLPLAQAAWLASGVPELQEALGKIVAATSAKRAMETARRRLSNLVTQEIARQLARAPAKNASTTVDVRDVAARLERLRVETSRILQNGTERIFASFDEQVAEISEEFVSTTVRTLVDTARRSGPVGVEECDPMFLRMRVKIIYFRMAREARTLSETVGTGLVQALSIVYGDILGDAGRLAIEPPQPPQLPQPVALGRTIAIDMEMSWWKTWLALHTRADTLGSAYRRLLEAEVSAIISEIRAGAEASLAEAGSTLLAFLDEQVQAATGMAGTAREGGAKEEVLGVMQALQTRIHAWAGIASQAVEATLSAGNVTETRNAV
jgi:GTP-binding protein EngB required for normal cell division